MPSRRPRRPCEHPELAAELARKRMLQRELAVAAGVHPNTIYLILSGLIRPTAEVRERIADVLGRPAAELFSDEVRA